MEKANEKNKIQQLMLQGKVAISPGGHAQLKRKGLMARGGRAQSKDKGHDAGKAAFVQALLKR